MASPKVGMRLDERMYARVLQAAETEQSTVSKWVRKAILDARERAAEHSDAALLAEARRYIATHPGKPETDVISNQVRLLEAVSGRLSAAERHGRAQAVAEIVGGALEHLYPAIQD